MSAAILPHRAPTIRCSQPTRRSSTLLPIVGTDRLSHVGPRGRCRGRSAVACQAPVVEPRVWAPERQFAQNSIVSFSKARRQDEVGSLVNTAVQAPCACALTQIAGVLLLQPEQPPTVPLFVGLCDELCAACQRQPEVSGRGLR